MHRACRYNVRAYRVSSAQLYAVISSGILHILACKRGGLAYGLLCAAATVGLMFLMTGLSVKWLMLVVIFAPYGVVTLFLERLSYFKLKSGLLRAVIAAVYFNVTVGVVYAVAVNVLTLGMDINITEWAQTLGGYAVLAVIATVVLVPLDFIFCSMSAAVLKKLPPIITKEQALKQKKAEKVSAQADNEQQPEYDIFGYEINSDKKSDDKS